MEERLRWHVVRCLAWLFTAGENQLMENHEPFEVPQCPRELLNIQFTVAHDEGSDTLSSWKDRMRQHGEIHWRVVPGFEKCIVAEKFLDSQGVETRHCRRIYQPSEKTWIGYWWLWPSPIVLLPWQAPSTWGELRQIGDRLEVDVDGFIRWMAYQAGGKDAVIILLGYPIPKLWNGPPVEIHWQAILSPNVPERILPIRGFRNNLLGQNETLRRDIFSGVKTLSYLKTTNWHPDRLLARGQFPPILRSKSIVVIGVGALGSAVAELLARGGVVDMLIVDHDALEVGNLVRHTLTGIDLGKNKATATVERLQGVAPMSRFTAFTESLPSANALQTLLDTIDIVLDCTGDDDALRHLDEVWWPIPKQFLSASLGFAAHRLFLFGAYACSFPFEEFNRAVSPWLVEERVLWSEKGETLEGAGCWSPLFPARSDDVWLAAVATVRQLEQSIGGIPLDGLRVFEQSSDEDIVGYHAARMSALHTTGNVDEAEGTR